MAGLVYYLKAPLFKPWQRMAIGFTIMAVALSVGTYFERLVDLRYSTFKGRTALYGDTTVRNGWLNSKPEEMMK